MFQGLDELRGAYAEARKIYREREEATWETLTYDQQLDVFCAVVRRICQAELVDQGSYRHALYSVFGFDMDAYGRAMDAGYLDLHNSIYAEDESVNPRVRVNAINECIQLCLNYDVHFAIDDTEMKRKIAVETARDLADCMRDLYETPQS